MEHQNQHCLARFKDKLVDNADLLMFVFFIVFTMFSFIQGISILIWLPILTTALACFFLRATRISMYQYNYRKVILLIHLAIYYVGFWMLQNWRTKTLEREKEKEKLVVLIYIINWFLIGTSLDVIVNRVWVAVLTVCAWVLATFSVVFIILCFEEIIPGEYCGFSN